MNPCPRVLLVLGLLSPVVGGQASSFEPVAAGPVATTPGESFGVAWGDIDGDGDLDLLVVDGNGPAANHLYRNNGDGTFTTLAASPVATSLGNSTEGSFADVDGDGDQDVFITNRSGSDNQLFVNQGGAQGGTQGVYVEDLTSVLVADGGDSTGLVWLDLEGDGDQDLFVTNSGGQSNFLYTNQGGAQGGVEGSFVRVTTGVAVTDTANSMDAVSADFDGDGSPDLYVANTANQNNFLFYNDGSGGFTAVVGTAPVNDAAPSQGVAAGDIDNDGDVDLVVANFMANNAVYVNMGGKQLGAQGQFQVWWAGPASLDNSSSLDVDLGDWDLDGNLDLVVATCCGNDNLLYVGDGNGRFDPVVSGPVVTDGGYSTAVAFADYDRDGGVDLVVANRSSSGSNFEFLYHNRSAGTWVERTAGHPVVDVQRAFDVAVGDIDGDGDADAFFPTKEEDPSQLYVNQGGAQGGVPGVFARATTGPLASVVSNGFAAGFGDVDGDGDLDVAVANREGEDNGLFLNQGGKQGGTQGDFAALTVDPVTKDGGNSRDVRFADVDNDGDLDLFFANSGDEDNFLYTNVGGSVRNPLALFQRDVKSVVGSQGGKSYGGDFGDIDGDGDVDLFVANRQGDDNFLYVNQGGKQGVRLGELLPVPSGPVVTMGGDSYAGTFGDMDNDGDLDLYVANNGVNFLYRNRGGAQDGTEGQFQNVVGDPSVTGNDASRRAEWGDIDGDGDLDLFVPNTTTDNDMFRNRGDGRFALMPTAVVGDDGGNSRGAAFVDVDGDSDLDILVANYDEPAALYVNKGLVGPALFTNLGKGLAGRLLPVLGGTGKLINKSPVRLQVVDGAPNSLAYIFVGSSVLNARLLGGTLVPTPDLLLGGLVTNSNGVMILDGTWPNVPVGATIYFQVWITDVAAPEGYSATNGLAALAH